MSVHQSRSRSALSKNLINLEDQYLNSIMDARNLNQTLHRKSGTQFSDGKRSDYRRQGHTGKMSRYFTLESLLLLTCLTMSLLILPLVLPPLPPPPFLLLLLPICILGLLMVLAFMPSDARGAAYTYA